MLHCACTSPLSTASCSSNRLPLQLNGACCPLPRPRQSQSHAQSQTVPHVPLQLHGPPPTAAQKLSQGPRRRRCREGRVLGGHHQHHSLQQARGWHTGITSFAAASSQAARRWGRSTEECTERKHSASSKEAMTCCRIRASFGAPGEGGRGGSGRGSTCEHVHYLKGTFFFKLRSRRCNISCYRM
jgi:hypothetical protein